MNAAPAIPHSRIRTEITGLWKLAWPMLVGQLATVGMGFVDVAMTGHAGATDLAAVALGTALWTMLMVTVIGVMLAINPVVAHEVGAGRLQRIPHIVRQALWQGLGVGLIAAILLLCSTPVFDLLQLDPAVHALARSFVQIISCGMPALAMLRALQGYSTSIDQTKPIMLISLAGLAYTIGVNWLLIYGHWGLPKLGALGCAVANASCLWLMLLAMVAWIRLAPAYRASYPFSHWEAPHWPEIRALLKMGLPIGVTYFAEVSAFCSVALLVAPFGVVQTSAHQIALNFASLTFMVPMSLGIALITRVGQALGEGDAQRARFIGWVGIGVALGFGMLSAAGIALLRYQIAAIYTNDPAVQALAAALLLLAAIFQLPDATQVMTASAIRGYKLTRPPMVIHLIAFWVICIPLGTVLGLAPAWLPWSPPAPLAARGYWLGLIVGLTCAALLLVWFFNRLSAQRVAHSTIK